MDSIDRFLGDELQALRGSSFETLAENGAPICPKVFCSWDQAQPGVEITATSAPDQVLTLNTKVQGAPQWLTLNFELGKLAIKAGDIIGLVVHAWTDQPCVLPLMMRSYFGETSHNTPFSEGLELCEHSATKTVMHTMSAMDEFDESAAYRTLILSLPKRDGQLVLQNLRLFRLPASYGLRSSAETLAAF